jgi:mutator protein MutT
MKRTRVAGIIPMENGFAFMHRIGVVKNKDYQEYYTFPGGGLEEGETPEEGTIREIKEELGIDVEIIKKVYDIETQKFNQTEIFYLCKYVGGKFGTGNGPEFSNNPKYADSGKYIPEIVARDEIENILLLPIEIKEQFINDVNKNDI